MPKYTVSRTRYFAVDELIEIEAGTDEEAIVSANEYDRSAPLPVGLKPHEIVIDEITNERGEFVYAD